VRTAWGLCHGREEAASTESEKVRGSRSVVSVLCDCGQLLKDRAGERGRQLGAGRMSYEGGIVGQTSRCIN